MAIPWGAIGSIGGALVGGLFGSSGQRAANQANLRIAREQMQFQKEMSDTSYTRAVADLKNAGLNPMLSIMNSGASTPPGASAVMQNEAGAGISSAVQAAGLALVKEQARKTKYEADAIKPEAAIKGEAGDLIQDAIGEVRKHGVGGAIKNAISSALPSDGFVGAVRDLPASVSGAVGAKGPVSAARAVDWHVGNAKKYFTEGGFKADLAKAKSPAELTRLYNEATQKLFSVANEGGANSAAWFRKAASDLRDVIRQYNLEQERRTR